MTVVEHDRATSAPALATASSLLGGAALLLLLTRPPLPVAVVLGTAGIVATALGLAALRLRPERRLLPGLGVVAGALAAILLVTALGLTLVDRRTPPAPSVPASSSPRAGTDLAPVVDLLAYLLSQSRDQDGSWPASVAVTADGRVYATSGPNVGHLLLQTPAGTSLQYAVNPDRSRMVLTLSMAGDPAATVSWSSATGLSTNE